MAVPNRAVVADRQAEARIFAISSLVRTFWAEQLLIAVAIRPRRDSMFEERVSKRRQCQIIPTRNVTGSGLAGSSAYRSCDSHVSACVTLLRSVIVSA
jgi:hypothetical protein